MQYLQFNQLLQLSSGDLGGRHLPAHPIFTWALGHFRTVCYDSLTELISICKAKLKMQLVSASFKFFHMVYRVSLANFLSNI